MKSGLALTEDRRTLGFIDLSFTDYEQGSFDRWSADAHLLHDFQAQSKLRGIAGLELSLLDGEKHYDFPYLGLLYRADPLHRFRLFHEFRAGRLHVPSAGHLDANQYRVSTGFTHLLRRQALLRGDISLETSQARETPYSFTGGSVGLEVDFPIGRWGLKPLIAFGKRDYRAPEPFFDEKREDLRKRIGLILSHRHIRFGRFEPELSIIYDRNDSSIDFYTYDKLSIAFSLQE
ncbi:surface lipoprotein assembly modifier [Marinobacterium aestuariivivens]|uniref:Surface lipoprotein assembly modifier n=1 Tax=Marinobacterium aestuariivivens TaxID=1698799 RepID=A0ABW2A998_9GAMM